MKKLVILFICLLTVFLGAWAVKSKQPVRRPDDAKVQLDETPWWTQKKGVPQAEEGWTLDAEIEANYIPVPGEDELYMVIDEDGYITAYRHRTKQPDGSWLWETVNPDIPASYEAVESLENVYKVTLDDGTVEYFLYIRNKDDTFAFVPVDENGVRLDAPKGGTSEIPENFVHVDENVYADYDEHGVLTGFQERYLGADGNYYWKEVDEPENWGSGLSAGYDPTLMNLPDLNNIIPEVTQSNVIPDNPTPSNQGGWTPSEPETTQKTVNEQDNTYTQVETITSTEHKDGWIITYQTVITKVYDMNGELISTKRENPVEVDRRRGDNAVVDTPDQSKIASTLQAEYARVSVGVANNTTLANEVLAQINAQRAASGASPLVMSGGDVYTIAAVKACDMATYDYSGYNSPLYGTIAQLCSRYGVSAGNPADFSWKTPAGKTASAIAEKLIAMTENTVKTGNYTAVALIIIEKNGYMYVEFVLCQ